MRIRCLQSMASQQQHTFNDCDSTALLPLRYSRKTINSETLVTESVCSLLFQFLSQHGSEHHAHFVVFGHTLSPKPIFTFGESERLVQISVVQATRSVNLQSQLCVQCSFRAGTHRNAVPVFFDDRNAVPVRFCLRLQV